MIKSIKGLKGDQVNWIDLGARLKQYRESRNINLLEASKQLGLSELQLQSLERGYARKDVNLIFHLSHRWDLSLNWLLNGKGTANGEDPPELMPQTLIVQKGAGIRRSEFRITAENGQFTDEVMEFVLAIDNYSRINGIPFPSKTQLFELILALGYRKTGIARIAPLGYIVQKQKEQEFRNSINEVIPDCSTIDDTQQTTEENPEQSELIPLLAPVKQTALKSKKKFNQKRRFQRQLAIKMSNLSEVEKERRRKIGERTRIRGKQYLFIDPEGRKYIIDSSKESVPDFCKKHKLRPAHMYSCANGTRPQHKGWKAQIIYQAPPQENQEQFTFQENDKAKNLQKNDKKTRCNETSSENRGDHLQSLPIYTGTWSPVSNT